MAGTIYIALSGMRTRMAQLDRAAADIANGGTSGYKAERAGTVAMNRPTFDALLDSAVDTAPSPSRIDFRPGAIVPTGRDLDLALDGKGFFVVQTPTGARYTRNGCFSRSADGSLVTADGMPVLGQDGPIKLSPGELLVQTDGSVLVNKTVVGKLKVVDFSDYETLSREDGGRFRAPADLQPAAKTGEVVRTGALEQSNVSMAQSMAHLMEISRAFETLQKGITLMSNDIDSRAISELGRR